MNPVLEEGGLKSLMLFNRYGLHYLKLVYRIDRLKR